MKKDLFGKTIRKRKSRAEQNLAQADRETFAERLERSEYVRKIAPRGYSFLGHYETLALLYEAETTFINGEFIATLMLSQAFIERRLQEYLESKGAKKTPE